MSRATGTAFLPIHSIVRPLYYDAWIRAKDCSIASSKLFLQDKIPLLMSSPHTGFSRPLRPEDTPYQLQSITVVQLQDSESSLK